MPTSLCERDFRKGLYEDYIVMRSELERLGYKDLPGLTWLDSLTTSEVLTFLIKLSEGYEETWGTCSEGNSSRSGSTNLLSEFSFDPGKLSESELFEFGLYPVKRVADLDS